MIRETEHWGLLVVSDLKAGCEDYIAVMKGNVLVGYGYPGKRVLESKGMVMGLTQRDIENAITDHLNKRQARKTNNLLVRAKAG